MSSCGKLLVGLINITKPLPVKLSYRKSLQLVLLSRAYTPQGGMRRISPGGAISSPQEDAPWRELLCLRRMAVAVWGMTQHRHPGGWPFSFLPRVSNPRLSSHSCSPHCPPSARTQVKWLQMNPPHWKALALQKGSCTQSHLSLVDRNPTAFYSCMFLWATFPVLVF